MVRWPRKYSSRGRRDTEGELNKRAGNIEAGSKLEGVRQSLTPSTGGVTVKVSDTMSAAATSRAHKKRADGRRSRDAHGPGSGRQSREEMAEEDQDLSDDQLERMIQLMEGVSGQVSVAPKLGPGSESLRERESLMGQSVQR